jgi:hypothetical protein
MLRIVAEMCARFTGRVFAPHAGGVSCECAFGIVKKCASFSESERGSGVSAKGVDAEITRPYSS